MDEFLFARLVFNSNDLDRLLATKKPENRKGWQDKLLELRGQIVEIMTESFLIFHSSDEHSTISPLRGPRDEGCFYVVPTEWLHGQSDEVVQYVGRRLQETFWERTEYTETP